MKTLFTHITIIALYLTQVSISAQLLSKEAIDFSLRDKSTHKQENIESVKPLGQESYEDMSAEDRAEARAKIEVANNSQKEDGLDLEDSNSKSQAYLSLLNSLVIGYVTSSLLANCKKMDTDIMMAAAGGLVYIYGEVTSSIDNVKSVEQIEKEYKEAKKQGNGQTAALEALRDDYKKQNESAIKKAQFQKAGAAALAGSAAISFYKSMQEELNGANCSAQIETASAAVKTGQGTTCTTEALANSGVSIANCNLEFTNCSTALLNAQTLLTKEQIVSSSPQKSMTMAPEIASLQKARDSSIGMCNTPRTSLYVKSLEGACLTFTGVKAQASAVCDMKSFQIVKNNNLNINSAIRKYIVKNIDESNYIKENLKSYEIKNLKTALLNYLEFGIDLLAPKAHALSGNMTKYLGLGAVGLGIYVGLTKTTSNAIDLMINRPRGRAIVFGGLAGSIFYASTVSGDIAEKAQKNANELDRVIKNGKKTNTTGIEENGSSSRTRTELDLNSLASNKTYESIPELSEPVCINSSSNNCPKIENKVSKEEEKILEGFGGSSFTSSVFGAGSAINGNSKISPDGAKFVDSLAKKSAVAMKNLRHIKSQYLKDLKDIDKNLSNDFLAFEGEFSDITEKAQRGFLKSKGYSSKSLLAEMGRSDNINSRDNKIQNNTSSKDTNKNLKTIASIGANKVKKKEWKLDFNFDPESAEMKDIFDMDSEKSGLLGAKNLDDVNEDRNKDLFKEISRRYMKSAYPILLEEIN